MTPSENETRHSGTPYPASTTALVRGKNYLFAVGINEYQHIRKLNNAVDDVERFVKLLTEKYCFEKEDVFTLFDDKASRSAILKKLKSISLVIKPVDSLIIYFSGHGEYNMKFDQGYWIPSEAHYEAEDEYIENHSIINILNGIDGRHIFIISDSCFSGSLFSDAPKSSGGERLESVPSRYALTPGRKEPVEDGVKGFNSPFARALLYTLEATLHEIGVSDLCNRVTEIVEANETQIPRGEPIKIKGHKGGQFFFRLRVDEETDWQAAKTSNKESGYSGYLKKYPDGQFEEEARKKLAELADEKEWKKALSIDEMFAYYDYLKKYPDGLRVAEARARIEFIEKAEEKENHENAEAEKKERARQAKIEADRERERLARIAAEQQERERLALIEAEKERARLAKIAADKEQARMAAEQQERERQAQIEAEKERFRLGPPEMIFVKGGSFKMGSNDYDSEKPIHTVTLDDFYIGKYPVTQKEWINVMGANPSHFKGDQLPVERVSWDDVQEFLQKINQKTGRKYRLPTEAEWEYAARGGAQSKGFRYSGSNNLKKVGWYKDNSENKTHPVGQLAPNELGIYDMSGNVWEWCEDCWHGDYKGAPSDGRAWLAGGNQSYRVCRGGSWSSSDLGCPVADRSRSDPTCRFDNLGFRVARGD